MFKKGFTLIELLVVIAIIAILAAILFPVFAQAREKARQASCLSNVKQIGTALQLYVDDYEESLPMGGLSNVIDGAVNPTLPGDWANNYPGSKFGGKMYSWMNWGPDMQMTWMDQIFPYVKNVNMYTCPSNGKNIPGYAMNILVRRYYTDHSKTIISLSMLKSTADFVFAADNIRLLNNSQGTIEVGPYASDYTKCEIQDAIQNTITNGSTGLENKYAAGKHNGGSNLVMADGHAKYFKRSQGPWDMSVHTSGLGYGNAYWDYTAQ